MVKCLITSFLFFSQIVGAAEQGTSVMQDNKYQKLEVYFVSWELLTRVRLRVEDVKRMRHVYMAIIDDSVIANISNAIHNHTFKENRTGANHDARLVLEFTYKNGNSEIYYASQNKLLSGDSKKIADLDKELLQKLNVFRRGD